MKKIREKLKKLPFKLPGVPGGFNPRKSDGGASYQGMSPPPVPNSARPLFISRPLSKTSESYFKKGGCLYTIILLSTLLDPIFFHFVPTTRIDSFSDLALTGAAVCMIIALTDFWKPLLLQATTGIKQKRKIFFDFQSKYSWPLYIVLTIAFTGSVLSKFNLQNFSFETLVQGFFALVVASVSAWTIIRQLVKSRTEQLAEENDLTERIEQANKVFFGTVVAEILAARFVCPLLAIAFIASGQSIDPEILGLFSFVGSGLLVGSQMPTRATFQAPCTRCRRLTSKAALSGLCIDCYIDQINTGQLNSVVNK